tara:strand:+ start:184 stop:1023 length:840 start_codon:yes stop_codon:yes gene_type:complete
LIKKSILFSFLISLFFGCSFLESDPDEDAIARVGDQYLLKRNLSNLVPIESEKGDSTAIVKNYIDNWVREQLLLQKAQQNLDEEEYNFQEQLENYRNSLIIFAYENQLIKQKLDTNVSDAEIREYYKENKDNFELREELYQLRFVQLLNTAPSKDSVEFWLFEAKENVNAQLNEYCTQFALGCHLDSSFWIEKSTLVQLIDLSHATLSLNFGKNRIQDSIKTSVIQLYGLKSSGSIAPISYVSDQIKSILINRRKIELIQSVKAQIYEDATLKRKYEVY